MRPERLRAAALFAAAGAAAGAVHVLAETPGALRDWRQTVPLAAAVGAVAGGFGFPAGGRAPLAAILRGAAVAAGALVAFATAFALGHGAIEAARGAAAPVRAAGDAFGRALGAMLGPGGVTAVGLGGAAGLGAALLGRRGGGGRR